jgi:hypothetical protein
MAAQLQEKGSDFPVIILALIAGGVALAMSAVFVVVVASIHSSDRQLGLHDPAQAGVAGMLVRRLLGVYTSQPVQPQDSPCDREHARPCGPAGR